jgi:hypothetical protein
VRAPGTEGRYLLQLDMVDEGVRWFSDVGWPGIIREISVHRADTDQASTSGIE